MYSELPQDLQQKVQELLVAGNFTSAKDMHDNWVDHQKAYPNYCINYLVIAMPNEVTTS